MGIRTIKISPKRTPRNITVKDVNPRGGGIYGDGVGDYEYCQSQLLNFRNFGKLVDIRLAV